MEDLFKKPYKNYGRVIAPKGRGSMTKQCFKDDVDINNIIKKYHKTGVMPYISHFKAVFGDFFNVTDYRTALHKLQLAKAVFEGIPVNVRERFDDDPGKFMKFVQDPANKDEIESLGLVEKIKDVKSVNDVLKAEVK